MIIDGNYSFLDFERIKPIMVDVFCRYYGDEFKKELQTKFDRVNYYGFHDYKDVVDYYNEYIEKYRDEIIYEFLKSHKLKADDKLIEELFPSDNYITENSISLALEGGEIITDKYSSKARKKILDSRKRIAEIFSLDSKDLFGELQELKKSLNKAIDLVERKHECDVFKDVKVIRENKRKVFNKYFKELTAIGVPITLKDRIIAHDEYFDDNSVYDLSSYGVFFDDEFLNESAVKAFTESYEEKSTFEEKYKFLYDRLAFLDYSGVIFLNFDSLQEIPENYEGLELLKKEYEYQKHHFQELESIRLVDINEWKKEWKNGNFIPKEIAESIEIIRDECQNELFLKTKNFDFYKHHKFNIGMDYCVTYNFDKNDHMKPYYNIFINEGLADKDYTLSAFIHELNHVAGFYPTAMGSNMIECKEGLSMLSFEYLNRFESEKECWDWFDDEYLGIFQENINQRLTKEIYEIFIKYYNNPFAKYSFKDADKCEYSYYDFITNEFYRANSKLLKKNVMDKSHTNLYYNSEGFYEKRGPLGELKRLIDDCKYKFQNEERTKYSVRELRKIGELMAYFEKEVLYFVGVKDISEEQIESGEYKNILSPDECKRLEYVIKQRNRLNKLLVDKRREKSESILEK